MAIEVLEQNQMLATSYEPLRQHRWVFSIDDNSIAGFAARSWARPNINQNETQLDYINTKTFLAGKTEPQTLSLLLNDPQSPSQSAAVLKWMQQHFEMASGRAGYAYGRLGYKHTCFLKMLDPQGVVVQTWELKGCWINTVDFGQLDYTSAETVQINLTLRFDTFEVTNSADNTIAQ